MSCIPTCSVNSWNPNRSGGASWVADTNQAGLPGSSYGKLAASWMSITVSGHVASRQPNHTGSSSNQA